MEMSSDVNSPSSSEETFSDEAPPAAESNGTGRRGPVESSGHGSERPSTWAQPDTLVLGPVDSPRFSMPPFESDNAISAFQSTSDASSSPPDAEGSSGVGEEPSYGPLGDGSPGQKNGRITDNASAGKNPHSANAELDVSDSPSVERDDNRPVDPLDALEQEMDADLIDEAASRMASSTSVASGTNDRVVEMLLRRDVVSIEQVEGARKRREEEDADMALWRVLARGEDVDEEAVYERAARIYAFSVADLEASTREVARLQSLVEEFTEEQQEQLLDLGVVPHRVETDGSGRKKKVSLVTHDPMRPEVHRVVRSLGLAQFELQYAPRSAVNELVSETFPRDNEYLDRIEEEQAYDLGQSFEEDEDLIDEEKLEEEINRSTLINLFEATLVEAVREGASDIHIFPNANKEVEIHFRMDGRLNHWHTEDRVHPEALLSVIKDNSMNVDRFESDAAQDGFIQRDVDGTRIRYRVSIMPIASSNQDIDSESVVIRVLDDRKVITDLDKLGLGPRALDRFEHAINQPNGMVILTGPTGSGKSTTLVAALHRVIGPEENVLTVEDPVEYIIEGARQIKLGDKLQLKDALRSILRHDPDTVMVGEMRDKETAELAIKLANTGHLTFSTLHTNDAPSAVSRLYKMGIEPFLLAYAINLVVAQRLIRTLCPRCKQEDPDPDPVLLGQLGFSDEEIETGTFYTPNDHSNCNQCGGTGYNGRRAIAEALYLTQPIRHMIVEADGVVDEGAIREHAQQEDDMRSLQASAREVVLSGQTSVDEMMRVVAS